MIEMLVGAGIFAAGWIAGGITRKRRTTSGGKAICGCGHGIGYHTDRTGQCHGTNYRKFDGIHDKCGCQVYSGPELITSFTSLGTEMLPPATEE